MSNQSSDLRLHWLVCAGTLAVILGFNLACHYLGGDWQLGFDESRREFLRSILYAVAIILFPFTKLLRHILLRLNQTMPGAKPAGQRYLATIIFCQALVEVIGSFGFFMFLLGDGFNTLYIFSAMAVLGVFLHKPSLNELGAIETALAAKANPPPESH